MAYKSSFTFTNTEKLKDFTIKSGSYSATYQFPFENVVGVIPQADCQSGVDMTYKFTCEQLLDDTYAYTLTFSSIPPTNE